eukprot:4562418-Alexandrium_andersonii.AAC.1
MYGQPQAKRLGASLRTRQVNETLGIHATSNEQRSLGDVCKQRASLRTALLCFFSPRGRTATAAHTSKGEPGKGHA